jgi:hypothetical protein
MFDEQSLFKGKEKEMFDLVRRHMPAVEHAINGNGEALLKHALNSIGDHVSQLPISDMLKVALPTALQRVIDLEQTEIHQLFEKTIEQINAIRGGLEHEAHQLITDILQSSDKWDTFQKFKGRLDTDIRQILSVAIERERMFESNYAHLFKNDQGTDVCHQAIADYYQAFSACNVTLATARTQRAQFQRIVERSQNAGGPLLKQAMNDFVNEISKHEKGTKSQQAMNLIKEHLEESVIRPFVENECEREMDSNDKKVADSFAKAISYVQKQKHRP